MSEIAVRDDRTPAQILTTQVRSPEFAEQVAMALPDNVPASRFQRVTVTALLQKPELAEVDRDSFFFSLLKCAADGLLPDGREAALVPYNGKCSYLPMIGGYRKVAGEYGWTIETVAVRAKDEFTYSLGSDPRVDHKPAPINSDRGELVAAYAIGRHRDGRRVIEVYEADKVAAAKGVAQTDRVWKQWPEQMWEKTVGKRLFQKLPLDPADKRVASLVVDAEEIGPAAAAAMLYGPGGSTFAAREITQDSSGEGAVSHGSAADASVRDATVGAPGDQAAGTEAPVSQPTDSPQGAADGGPGASADTTQQAAVGEAGSGDEPGADGTPAAAPGPARRSRKKTAEPEAPPAQEGFQIPAAVLDEAGATAVVHNDPKSGWNGRTISDIAKDQEYGAAWLTWAAGSDGDLFLSAETVAAVRLYVEHRLPDLWAQVTA